MQKQILNEEAIRLKVLRLAHSLAEGLAVDAPVTLVGISGNGFLLASQLKVKLEQLGLRQIAVYELLVHKDNPYAFPPAIATDALRNRDIVVVDDVLNTGLTMMYALSWCMSLQPRRMKCLVLVDRDYKRFPVHPELVGLRLHTPPGAHVEVKLGDTESGAWLHNSAAPRDIEA